MIAQIHVLPESFPCPENSLTATYKYVYRGRNVFIRSKTMPRQPSKTFTDRELEIMRIVWRLGEASARQIQQELPGDRHYNSVMTIIRVLEKKNHLVHREEGRTYFYRATQNPHKARSRVLKHLIKHVFGGSPKSLVLNLVETGDLHYVNAGTVDQQNSLLLPCRRSEEQP